MFLRSTIREKDGKRHRYWGVVESRGAAGGRLVQRPVLYLGEINDSQAAAWRKSIEVLEEGSSRPRTLSLFPDDRAEGLVADGSIVWLRLSEVRLCRPRQWGGCWLAWQLWQQLQLDRFWWERMPALPPSPGRRTRPSRVSTVARRSRRPRSIMLRAIPVAC